MLLRKINKQQFGELPEELKKYYLPEGDDYLLDADVSDLKNKVDEFRTNNTALMKAKEKQEKLLKQYEGIDPVKAREAAKKLEELEDQNLLDEGKMEELLEKRTERMQAEFANKYKALEEANSTLTNNLKASNSELSRVLVSSQIVAAVGEVGTIRKGAMNDVISRAHEVWKLDENRNLVPMVGEDVKFGADGKTPMTQSEWASDLVQNAPFLFEGTKGSNADGNDTTHNLDKGAIDAGDRESFSNNIEDIAKGKIVVNQ